MFSPEQFLNSTIEGAMSVRVMPVPQGEYVATISKLIPRETSKDGSVPCDIIFEVDDANLKETLKRSKITTKMTAWLDFTSSGGLDNAEGKNVTLGRVRAAVGQNDPTKPWAPSMLVGQPLRIKVIHESDKKTGDIYDKVSQVIKL